MALNRTSPIAEYAAQHFVRERAVWKQVHAAGEAHRLHFQMTAYEASLLAFMLRLHGARRVLEIGSFAGYSALWFAEVVGAEGQIVTLERDAECAALTRVHVAQHGQGRIEAVEADALAWLTQYQGAAFDALLIDGEKKSYALYLEAALPHLRKGGLVMADNTLLFGAVLGEEPQGRVSPAAIAAMQQFHAMIADQNRFETMMLPTNEGMILAVKK